MPGPDPLDRLAAAFDEVAARDARRRVPRPSSRRLLLALLALLVPATAIAAGTGLLSRDEVSAPRPADVPREAQVMAGSGRVLALRVADPDGGPSWTLRLARSRAGLRCVTAGQVASDGRFGLVGLDGRFRVLPEAVADTCGDATGLAPWITSVRTLAGSGRLRPLTIVAALAGRRVRAAEVRRGDGEPPARAVAAGPDGAVLAVLPGTAEAIDPRLLLRLADGREDVTEFLRSPRTLVDDPYGRAPWRLEAQGSSRRPGRGGAQLAQSDPDRAFAGRQLTPVVSGDVRREGVVAGVRRFSPGWRSADPAGPRQPLYAWSPYARAVTVVWGAARDDVRRVEIRTPDGRRRSMVPRRTLVSYQPRRERRFNPRGFAFVLDGRTDPSAVRIRVRYADGRTVDVRGRADLERLGPQPPFRAPQAVTARDRAPRPAWRAGTGPTRVLRAADPAGGADWVVRVRPATRARLRGEQAAGATVSGTCLLLARRDRDGTLRTATGRPAPVAAGTLGQCLEDRWARGRFGALLSRTPVTGATGDRPRAPLTALFGLAPQGSARVELRGLSAPSTLPVGADGAFLVVRPTERARRAGIAVRGLTGTGAVVGGRRGAVPDDVLPDASARLAVRVPDPDGLAPWGVHAGDRGPQCAAVGQVVGTGVGVLRARTGTFLDATAPRCGGTGGRTRSRPVQVDVQRLGFADVPALRAARRTRPGRTAVVLFAREDVRRIRIRTSRGTRTLVPRGRARAALAVWDGSLTGSLVVEGVLDDGRRWRAVRPVGG